MARKIVPDLVSNQVLTILSPYQTVQAAAEAMLARNIGAVLVAEDNHLVGIFTERDIAHRVVARGRDPRETLLDMVMTRDPATVSPGDCPSTALEMMRRLGCRHLPVVTADRIVGMLSIRDLYVAIQQELEEDLKLRDELFLGSGYSVAH